MITCLADSGPMKIMLDGVSYIVYGKRTPAEYQEVEWLQADKDVPLYIDLGFNFDIKAKIYLDQWTLNNSVAYPFGAVNNNEGTMCSISSLYSTGKLTFYGSSNSGYIQTSIPVENGKRNEILIEIAPGQLSLTNQTTKNNNTLTSQGSVTMGINLYLFARNYDGLPKYGDVRRISGFKYWDKNDNLICDLVPCFRKSDGVAGMYDIVRKRFLPPVGSGSFTLGRQIF